MSHPALPGAPADGSEPPLIELTDITRSFQNGDLQVQVLHGISLTIHAGEFVAIMGASGSGKTTLMNILGCLDRPTSGSFRFMGAGRVGLCTGRAGAACAARPSASCSRATT